MSNLHIYMSENFIFYAWINFTFCPFFSQSLYSCSCTARWSQNIYNSKFLKFQNLRLRLYKNMIILCVVAIVITISVSIHLFYFTFCTKETTKGKITLVLVSDPCTRTFLIISLYIDFYNVFLPYVISQFYDSLGYNSISYIYNCLPFILDK